MTRRRRDRQATDAGRIGRAGLGKLDEPSARGPARPQKAVPPESNPGQDRPPAITGRTLDAARRRLLAEREILVRRFRELGVSLNGDEVAPRARIDTVLDEGDEAQASERRDMALAARARLASRIERLTAAVERIERGTYGTSRVCGRTIETPRLAALPEADTCLRCQEELDRGRTAVTPAQRSLGSTSRS
jgi:DnaK suppressor protein